MKAILRFEIIGDDINAKAKAFGMKPTVRHWVAEIIGYCAKYEYSRIFLKGYKDYTHANSKGSRGVFMSYVLESNHIYEIKDESTRYFASVMHNGDILNMSKTEVDQWLSAD